MCLKSLYHLFFISSPPSSTLQSSEHMMIYISWEKKKNEAHILSHFSAYLQCSKEKILKSPHYESKYLFLFVPLTSRLFRMEFISRVSYDREFCLLVCQAVDCRKGHLFCLTSFQTAQEGQRWFELLIPDSLQLLQKLAAHKLYFNAQNVPHV